MKMLFCGKSVLRTAVVKSLACRHD
jgi:hypothetical protein